MNKSIKAIVYLMFYIPYVSPGNTPFFEEIEINYVSMYSLKLNLWIRSDVEKLIKWTHHLISRGVWGACFLLLNFLFVYAPRQQSVYYMGQIGNKFNLISTIHKNYNFQWFHPWSHAYIDIIFCQLLIIEGALACYVVVHVYF